MEIKCRRCGSTTTATPTEDMPKETHHLECDWCEKCERGGYDDFWESYCCDDKGKTIE